MKKYVSLVLIFLICTFYTGIVFGSDFFIRDGDLQIESTAPALKLIDSDAEDNDVNAIMYIDASDTGSGTEDVDFYMKTMVDGTLTTIMHIDADGDVDFQDRDVVTTGTFSGLFIPAGMSNTYIPYLTSSGFNDSPMTTDGVDVTN